MVIMIIIIIIRRKFFFYRLPISHNVGFNRALHVKNKIAKIQY